MSRKYDQGKDNPFAGGGDTPSINDVDQAIYGAVDVPTSGRVVAKPIPLDQIRPDLTQPRKAVPLAVRGQWTGEPEDVPAVLAAWHKAAQTALGKDWHIEQQLEHWKDEPSEYEHLPQVVFELLELISLAGSIQRDGLANPISVSKAGAGYVIETGERRWLAHWLLKIWSKAGTDRIPAIVKDRPDVWRQAAENGARRPLNAIGMARQMSLLVMDMYRGDDGVRFDRYEDIVMPGECDRRFYAQVANGNVYRIKRGMGPRIQDVTGVKSRSHLAKYRNLLTISDAVWTHADLNNWPEGRIRNHVATLDELKRHVTDITPYITDDEAAVDALKTAKNAPKSGYTLPIVNVSGEKGAKTGGSGGFVRDESDAPKTPYRTRIGERMGLYDDPHPPAPSPAGEGENPDPRPDDEEAIVERIRAAEMQGRPALTKNSSDTDWEKYRYAPHPSEYGYDERWTEEDESDVAVQEYFDSLEEEDGAGPVLSDVPIISQHEMAGAFLQMIHALEKQTSDDMYVKSAATGLLRINEADLYKLAERASGADLLHKYQADLEAWLRARVEELNALFGDVMWMYEQKREERKRE